METANAKSTIILELHPGTFSTWCQCENMYIPQIPSTKADGMEKTIFACCRCSWIRLSCAPRFSVNINDLIAFILGVGQVRDDCLLGLQVWRSIMVLESKINIVLKYKQPIKTIREAQQ
jgi:hypothetical protein